MTRAYLKVRTKDVTHDMTRYNAYLNVPQTDKPIRMEYNHRTRTMEEVERRGALYHTFEEGEFTYYMRPSCYNANWDRHAVDRYASFGVKTTIERR